MRPNSCVGCRSHYRERHWWIFMIDFCGLDGDVVGRTDVCSEKDLLFIHPYIGFNGGAAALHAEKGETLDLVSGLKKGLGKESCSDHRSLTAATMKSDFQHGPLRIAIFQVLEL